MSPALVDVLLILLIGLFALGGIRAGLTAGLLELAGLALAFGAGLAFNHPAARIAEQQFGIPSAIGDVIAFFLIVGLVEVVFGFVRAPIVAAFRLVAAGIPPLAWIDHLLGIMPGLVRGVLVAVLIVLPLATFPLLPSVVDDIRASTLGNLALTGAKEVKARLDPTLGRDLAEGLALIGPPPREEALQLPFRVTSRLQPDPDEETRMLDLINQERRRAGLSPLAADAAVRPVARQHSEEMFRLGYFAHESPTHGSPADRLRSAGITYGVLGENLAYAPSLETAHQGLMQSPGHRANILSPNFRRVGIGVIRSEFRGKMYTQDFRD